jgi:hypothetical protein
MDFSRNALKRGDLLSIHPLGGGSGLFAGGRCAWRGRRGKQFFSARDRPPRLGARQQGKDPSNAGVEPVVVVEVGESHELDRSGRCQLDGNRSRQLEQDKGQRHSGCVSGAHVMSMKESQAEQPGTANHVAWCRRYRKEP